MQATAATVVDVYPLAGCPLSRSRTAVFSLGQYTKFFQGSHAVLVVQILHLIILSVALVAVFDFKADHAALNCSYTRRRQILRRTHGSTLAWWSNIRRPASVGFPQLCKMFPA